MKKKRPVEEFIPLNDQVIVKIIKEKTVTKAGILIPDSVGYVEQGGAVDFYKIEILALGSKAAEACPELLNTKYGFTSIFSGHYLMTDKDSCKVIPALTIVAVINEKFALESLKPTAGRVLVKEKPLNESTESGIYVGDMKDPRSKEVLEGEIMSTGDLVTVKELKQGYTAVYDPYVGNILPRIEGMDNIVYKTIYEFDISVVFKD